MTTENDTKELRSVLTNLAGIVQALDHKVHGNGKPGLLMDVADLKHTVDSIKDSLLRVQAQIVNQEERLIAAIRGEADKMRLTVHDTQEIKGITKDMIRDAFDEYDRKMAEAAEKKRQQEKEAAEAPGTWHYFRKTYVEPAILYVMIAGLGALLAILLGK